MEVILIGMDVTSRCPITIKHINAWASWNYLGMYCTSLRWRHNELDGVSDHQPHDCLLNRLFGRRSKKASKLRVTGLCAGNSPGTGEFPAQMASNAENVSIWWRHHVLLLMPRGCCNIVSFRNSSYSHITRNLVLLATNLLPNRFEISYCCVLH